MFFMIFKVDFINIKQQTVVKNKMKFIVYFLDWKKKIFKILDIEEKN